MCGKPGGICQQDHSPTSHSLMSQWNTDRLTSLLFSSLNDSWSLHSPLSPQSCIVGCHQILPWKSQTRAGRGQSLQQLLWALLLCHSEAVKH